MKAMLRIAALSLSFAQLLARGQQINVSICNREGVSDAVIFRARAEAGLVYGQAGVEIVWRDCEEFPEGAGRAGAPWYVIAVRSLERKEHVNAASLEVMGEAFLDGPDGGEAADAYLPAIRETAEEGGVDGSVLLGYVMAHELGHLILGPGHAVDGIMRGAWGQKQIDALRQRRLRFTREGAERVRRAIAARTKRKGADGRPLP